MKASGDLGPSFIKKDDIPNGGLIATVDFAERRDVSRKATEHDYRWFLTFEEGWKLQLNKTNLRKAIELLGDETDDWPGQQLGLINDPTIEYEGEQIGGIRVVAAKDIKRRPRPKAADGDSIPF
jgi:hypothetical protein